MLFVVVIMIYPDPIKLQRRVGYNEEGDEMVSFVTVSNFSRWQITTAEVALVW